MFRIYFYLFVSINFLALTCLFIVSFVNIIFIREEFVEIPEIKSSNNENFIIPNEVKNNDYNFKILNHSNDYISENLKFIHVDDVSITNSKLALINAVMLTIKSGLNILSINPMEEM